MTAKGESMNGWLRLAIFLTAFWVGSVLFFTAHQYRSVSRGGSPLTDFVHLRDSKTGDDFGRLSFSEVQEYGELSERRSRSPQGEAKDAANAKRLLAAKPVPFIDYWIVLYWAVIPVLVFWMFFIGIRWVAAGFQKTA